jgi:hypothetical protein
MEHLMTAAQERKEWLLKHMGQCAVEPATMGRRYGETRIARASGK